MSLCNLLKRPQRFDLADLLESLKELELSERCWRRGHQALRTDPSFRNMLDQVCENALRRFQDNHQFALNVLSDQLDTYLHPHKQAINQWMSALGGKDCDHATEYLLSSIMDWVEAIEEEEIASFLSELFNLLHDEMEAGIQSLFTEMIDPAIDELSALLEDDFISGVTDSSAFNRFMLGKDLQDLKEKLLAVGNEIPPFAREYYLDPLLNFLRTSPLLTQLDQIKKVIKSSKEVLEKLLAVLKIVSTNSSVQGSGFGQYLWYASWLLEDNYWEINGDYCQGPLFTLDNTYSAALDSTQFPAALASDFNDQFSLNANPLVQVITAGEHWQLKGSNGDPDFYLIRRNGNGKIKTFRIYPATEWKQIAPLTNYTFKTINAGTCNDWAYHSSWFIDLVKGILHALSMEPTAATGNKSDALSNLSNMLLSFTYGSLKLGGPKGCAWSQTDPNLNSIWAKSVLPFIGTMVASLEGIHRNTGSTVGAGGARFSYWLSLATKDIGEKYLLDHWCQLIRDAVLGYITLINYEGPRIAPSSGLDNRPNNRKTFPLLVKLMDEIGVWLTIALFPQDWYGFPSSENADHGGKLIAHWLGAGSIIALANTLLGTKIAESIGEVEDHTAICKSLKRGVGNMLVKFPIYLYLANEGNTRMGRLSHVTTPMFGYPSANNSPYSLPFPNGIVQHCVQGNQGLWSHNSLQDVSSIYAYDFALDFDDDVVAAREGIVWAFADNQPDDTDTDNNWTDTGNFIQLLHTGDPDENHEPLDGHDLNLQKDKVRTFAEYRHGRADSIGATGGALHTGITTVGMRLVSTVLVNANVKSAFADYGVDLDRLFAEDAAATIAVEVTVPGGDLVGPYLVPKGEIIMRAGNTGRIAFNQLHMQVQPARQDADGTVVGMEAYTIPFVFQEVKSGFSGRVGVARTGYYYQSENG